MKRLSGSLLAVLLAGGSALHAHPPLLASLAAVERQLERDPADPVAWQRRGELLVLVGRLEEAEEALRRAAVLRPDARPTLLLAELRLAADQPAVAEAVLSVLLAGDLEDAQRPVARLLRSRARRLLGRPRDALADLERALDDAPRPAPELYLDRDALLRDVLGRVHGEARRRRDEARLAGLLAGIDRLGDVPALLLRAVGLEVGLGRLDAALGHLAALAGHGERNDEWWLLRGELLAAAGRLAEAAEAAAMASSAFDRRPLGDRRSRAGALRRSRLEALQAKIGSFRVGSSDGSAPARPTSLPATPGPPLVFAGRGTPLLLRGPYLQSTTPDSVVLRWRTDQPSGSRVDWGPSPGVATDQLFDPTPVTEHLVTVGSLAPGSCSYYTVGTATTVLAGGDDTHRFCTAPPAGTPIRVWAIGDSGTASADAVAVRDAYLQTLAPGTAPDVWLLLGDNAYLSGTDAEYQAALFDVYPTLLRQTAAWPALGNHDALSADAATQTGPYFDLFSLPTGGEAGGMPSGTEAYYSFDHGDVHFVCLDSAGSPTPTAAMLDWLAADLASTGRTWTIATFHHPPYTKGSHDSDLPADSGGRMFAVRQQLLPILEAYGVDLVLAGHSHVYERSFLLDGHYGTSDTLLPAMILDGGSGSPDDGTPYEKRRGPAQGAVYVVAGSSGVANAGNGTLDHPVMVLSLERLGSLLLEVDATRIEGRFLDDSGVFLDHFELRRDPASLFLDGFESGSPDRWDTADAARDE